MAETNQQVVQVGSLASYDGRACFYFQFDAVSIFFIIFAGAYDGNRHYSTT